MAPALIAILSRLTCTKLATPWGWTMLAIMTPETAVLFFMQPTDLEATTI